MAVEEQPESARLVVRNIGGISETEVGFTPGVTIFAGRNATNRTSLLRALMAGLGSEQVSMKADADEASVELSLGGETYTRTFERRNGEISTGGDPYLSDPTLADLFAFLLESNDARRAVATDDDLRDLIMRPIDTDEIQAEINHLVEQRRQVTEELEELDELKDRLPALEEERAQLDAEIDDVTARLRDVEERLERADADVEESQEERTELEATLADLRERRSELEDVRYDLETEKDSLQSLRSEQATIQDEYGDLPEAPADELEELDARIEGLRARKQHLESELNELRSVIQFNEDVLDDAGSDLLDGLAGDTERDAVTDDLLSEETVTCWTCGSDVDREQIESTVAKLREVSQETVAEIDDIDDELSELDDRRSKLQSQQQRRDRLERRRGDLEAEIETTQNRIDELSTRRDELREEIEAIEREVETLESDSYEEILDLHREANQLEYDLGAHENDLERVEANIATIEDRLDEEADLKARREELNEELTSLRTRIEQIERQAIEAFNEHMEAVLDLLEYENLERIWLERSEKEVREGRRRVTTSVFDFHVVRRTDAGATYEDTVDHLSESEREVTGLIFALAGYLAHEIFETMPVLVLDSLEAIDSERIARFVTYVSEYAEYVLVALLPEDATALDDEYTRITEF